MALGSLLSASAGAAECRDPGSFQGEVLAVIQREFPEQAAHRAAGDVIEAGGFVFRLDNLRRLVCAPPGSGPEERARIIRDHFQKGFQTAADIRSGKKLDWVAVREHVIVQLVQEQLASQLKLLRRSLVRGVAVVVVLDLSAAYLYVDEEQPARWGVAREELFDQAVENLAHQTRGEMRSAGDGGERVLFVGEHDGYDAARILTPGLRKAAARLLGDPFRAAVPNREFLVMWARGNAAFTRQADVNARRDFEAQPYPISPLILEVWADGRITAAPASPAGP